MNIKSTKNLLLIPILIFIFSTTVFALTYTSPNYTLKNARIVVSGGKASSYAYSLNNVRIGNAFAGKISSANYTLDATNIDKIIEIVLAPNPPTLNPVISPTDIPTQTLTGTKDEGTSVYNRGYQVVPLTDQTDWSCEIDLSPGNNYLVLIARNAQGLESDSVHETITLIINPHTPTILLIQPPNESTAYTENSINFSVSAEDQDNDTLSYQFSLDGAVICPWQSSPEFNWSTSGVSAGVHSIKVEVSDNKGGEVSQEIEVCLFRNPPALPSP